MTAANHQIKRAHMKAHNHQHCLSHYNIKPYVRMCFPVNSLTTTKEESGTKTEKALRQQQMAPALFITDLSV